MTFEKAEDACRQVKELAEKLLKFRSPEDAKALEQKCSYYAANMVGRFGNVAGQLSLVATAAKMYRNSRTDVATASSKLGTALLRVEHAIRVHRNSDRSRWQE